MSKSSASPAPAGSSKAPDRFHMLIGRALVDEEYRAKLLDPSTRAAALKDIGIARPTKNQLTAVENAITALRTMNGTFGEGVGAA